MRKISLLFCVIIIFTLCSCSDNNKELTEENVLVESDTAFMIEEDNLEAEYTENVVEVIEDDEHEDTECIPYDNPIISFSEAIKGDFLIWYYLNEELEEGIGKDCDVDEVLIFENGKVYSIDMGYFSDEKYTMGYFAQLTDEEIKKELLTIIDEYLNGIKEYSIEQGLQEATDITVDIRWGCRNRGNRIIKLSAVIDGILTSF